MPGISKKPSFSHQDSAPSSPSKKTVRLAENPHVSAFLSPKSRIFTGGHGYPGPPGPMARQSYASASAVPDAFSVNGKQLTPDEVAQKIASMLKPGPPFFSRVSNADLIDFISDGSIMNCDKLRAAAAAVEERKHANRALTAFVPSGTVVRRRAEEERWTGVGTVWSSLEGLPAGASWGQIPTTGSTLSVRSQSGVEDDGMWNAITLSCDLDCTTVELAKSVVVPTQVLHNNHFFNGNADSLFQDIGAGIKFKFDSLTSKTSLRHKPSSSNLGGGSKIMPSYLSLSAYTDPNNAFTSSAFELKWPSWMPWVKKSTTPETAAPETPVAGGQKRVWVPSSTKISIHASWWGYNLYLPQPVLDSLDGDVDEAEKVANLINKCLTYILNNVPAGLPSAFGAVITILKAIAPTTGYISTFIGWSWDTIKSFNKGQGVVLSATWILPVALIPRAWDAPTNPNSATPTPTDPSATPTTPTTPAAPSAPAAPVSATPVGGSVSGMPVTAQDVTDPESVPLPDPNVPAVPAPGATLPPTNPSTVNVDLSPPPANDTANATYPGDARGRGGDPSTSGPMGNTPAPANQTPIDAES
ncbi:hypothetical protein PANT_10d00053 [Moesziomyces antarcticus T-34]|uniref:Uncharacterized protein n=1 Tax=Pseudozyma antarctica (strain T-34) TaxID=1151754 RepID=M9MFB4_PSEA3|nr:hypothetical protein PANT_10d00053 [Moesziomyces antarcticus T-34]